MTKRTDMLTLTQVANQLGLAVSTLTSYRARGYMPRPDAQYGRTPVWKPATITRWRAGQTKATR
jgi:predicted site-specific integrase-resolvase